MTDGSALCNVILSGVEALFNPDKITINSFQLNGLV